MIPASTELPSTRARPRSRQNSILTTTTTHLAMTVNKANTASDPATATATTTSVPSRLPLSTRKSTATSTTSASTATANAAATASTTLAAKSESDGTVEDTDGNLIDNTSEVVIVQDPRRALLAEWRAARAMSLGESAVNGTRPAMTSRSTSASSSIADKQVPGRGQNSTALASGRQPRLRHGIPPIRPAGLSSAVTPLTATSSTVAVAKTSSAAGNSSRVPASTGLSSLNTTTAAAAVAAKRRAASTSTGVSQSTVQNQIGRSTVSITSTARHRAATTIDHRQRPGLVGASVKSPVPVAKASSSSPEPNPIDTENNADTDIDADSTTTAVAHGSDADDDDEGDDDDDDDDADEQSDTLGDDINTRTTEVQAAAKSPAVHKTTQRLHSGHSTSKTRTMPVLNGFAGSNRRDSLSPQQPAANRRTSAFTPNSGPSSASPVPIGPNLQMRRPIPVPSTLNRNDRIQRTPQQQLQQHQTRVSSPLVADLERQISYLRAEKVTYENTIAHNNEIITQLKNQLEEALVNRVPIEDLESVAAQLESIQKQQSKASNARPYQHVIDSDQQLASDIHELMHEILTSPANADYTSEHERPKLIARIRELEDSVAKLEGDLTIATFASEESGNNKAELEELKELKQAHATLQANFNELLDENEKLHRLSSTAFADSDALPNNADQVVANAGESDSEQQNGQRIKLDPVVSHSDFDFITQTIDSISISEDGTVENNGNDGDNENENENESYDDEEGVIYICETGVQADLVDVEALMEDREAMINQIHESLFSNDLMHQQMVKSRDKYKSREKELVRKHEQVLHKLQQYRLHCQNLQLQLQEQQQQFNHHWAQYQQNGAAANGADDSAQYYGTNDDNAGNISAVESSSETGDRYVPSSSDNESDREPVNGHTVSNKRSSHRLSEMNRPLNDASDASDYSDGQGAHPMYRNRKSVKERRRTILTEQSTQAQGDTDDEERFTG
ncbi:hypothetical protein GQ42DRAFT_178101 [Ramicandelaber brevisporus]|nr:hypothetical protein GQ42DRAFT_178101 [Ramicandelaber brevisporus]